MERASVDAHAHWEKSTPIGNNIRVAFCGGGGPPHGGLREGGDGDGVGSAHYLVSPGEVPQIGVQGSDLPHHRAHPSHVRGRAQASGGHCHLQRKKHIVTQPQSDSLGSDCTAQKRLRRSCRGGRQRRLRRRRREAEGGQ